MPLSPKQLDLLQSGVLYDLFRFGPETLLALSVVVLLLLRLFRRLDHVHLALVAAVPVLIALGLVAVEWNEYLGVGSRGGTAFSGLLKLDPFAAFLRGLLLVFALLGLLLGRITGIPDRSDSGDYAVLLLGGTLGMMVMVSANHLLMVFVGLEMASLPCYALAGFLKGRKPGSEAALKYVLYGSAASGVALYGISLLVTKFGGGAFDTVANGLAQPGGLDLTAGVGLVLLSAGFAFKLSAVPLHFWCPDVFEGAAAEVGAFLSVASKAAAVGLTARFLMSLQQAAVDFDTTLWPKTIGIGVMVVAGVTATVGNLAALGQTNLKRMLAYSTIAHAGYMLMGLAPLTADGVSGVLFYLAGYLPANLGAFAVIALIRNATGGESIDDVRGLMKRSPVLATCLVLFLLSLLGVPPLVGFAGKFQVFEALFAGGRPFRSNPDLAWLGTASVVLLGLGVLNTVISAGYYVRVLKAAVLDDPGHERPGELAHSPVADAPGSNVAGNVLLGVLGVLALAVVVLGLAWNPLTTLTTKAVQDWQAQVK